MDKLRQLDPQLEKWLTDFNRRNAQLLANGFTQTPTNAREGLSILTRMYVTDRKAIPLVQDDLVYKKGHSYGVPIRIYHPLPQTDLPLFIYFHGGGGMAGSVSDYDNICRKLAVATNYVVVSVDYRLAPECPYPSGLEDAIQVTENLLPTLDQLNLNFKRNISIGGDSGGGALCSSVAHFFQDHQAVQISNQVLIYPSLDYTMQGESLKENSEDYLLHSDKIKWYFDNYFQNNEERRQASPLYMNFTDKLPRSMVITTEFCPLRDEGVAYVKKLSDLGVTTRHLHFEDMIHAFVNLEDLVPQQCARLYAEIGDFLN